MKNILNIALCTLVLGALCSCSNDIDENNNIGNGSLSVVAKVSEATRAAMTNDELMNSAIVKIYKADFSGKVREYRYDNIPSSLYLPADDYRVDVQAGELVSSNPKVASWEQKSYQGSKEVTVVAGETRSVEVVAKISNVVSNISFDSSVPAAFYNGYDCEVSLKQDFSGDMLIYSSAESGKDAYFLPSGFEPSLYWKFSGKLRKDGSTLEKSGEIQNVEAGKRYTMTLKYTEKDGIVVFDIKVDDTTNDVEHNIIFEPTSTGVTSTGQFEIWAGHFTAHADVDETEYDSSKVYFEYRTVGSTTWNRVPATRDSEGVYSALINSLTPSTEYEYQLVVTENGSTTEETLPAPNTITTENAIAIPNGSFEETSEDESSKFKSFYAPNSSILQNRTKWWDSGNKGSTLVGSYSVIAYPDTGDKMDGNQSVCLQSRYLVVKFAAGNLFSGRFGELVGTKGGTVFFGRPFTARPTALRFWVKYKSGKVNRQGDAPTSMIKTGDDDRGEVKIALGTWDFKKYGGDATSPVLVNTTKQETIVDYNTLPETIAYNHLVVMASDSQYSTWKQVTLPLNYKDTNKYPTHIVISCAASMYGDYFAGYDGSHLWLDGMELLYE